MQLWKRSSGGCSPCCSAACSPVTHDCCTAASHMWDANQPPGPAADPAPEELFLQQLSTGGAVCRVLRHHAALQGLQLLAVLCGQRGGLAAPDEVVDEPNVLRLREQRG